MFAIGAYNTLETGIVTFDTFKHYHGLYFYSMQVASWGILLHALPAMVRFVSAPNLPMSIPFVIGWYAMVDGQALCFTRDSTSSSPTSKNSAGYYG